MNRPFPHSSHATTHSEDLTFGPGGTMPPNGADRARAFHESHRPALDPMAGSAEATAPALPAGLAAVDAHEVLRGEARQLERAIAAKRLDVEWRLLARHAYLPVDPERLRRVYRSLLTTAVDAAKKGDRITIRSTCPSDCALRVEVEEHSAWAHPPKPQAAPEPPPRRRPGKQAR